MDKKVISSSFQVKGGLDDEYTLYDDGTILHEYDKHIYPGGQNLRESLNVIDLSGTVKNRLLEAASAENKALVRETLKFDTE
ncbi:MAG: hypothetical protein KA270_07010 [Saprospiraceae bacterium]|nr:hypothetical protein [Saprospiraceae bacterium]MBP6566898.1 hypothetical protein [Saprospiraceae bacterium]